MQDIGYLGRHGAFDYRTNVSALGDKAALVASLIAHTYSPLLWRMTEVNMADMRCSGTCWVVAVNTVYSIAYFVCLYLYLQQGFSSLYTSANILHVINNVFPTAQITSVATSRSEVHPIV